MSNVSDVNYLLNKIILKDGRTLYGIVDYLTKKQIYFFDFTHETNIDYTLLAILWKGNTNNLRFSVFCAIEYPEISLPKALLIPKSNISSILGKIPTFDKPKQKKRIIRYA